MHREAVIEKNVGNMTATIFGLKFLPLSQILDLKILVISFAGRQIGPPYHVKAALHYQSTLIAIQDV